MEDMSESDLLPKNMIKVPEVYKQSYSLYCQSSYGERERGGEGKGRRGKGERREAKEGRGARRVHIYCIVTMSLCLCSYVKKS